MKEKMPEKNITPSDSSSEKVVDLTIQKISDYCFGVEKINFPTQKIELQHEIIRLMKQGAGFSEEVVDYIVGKIEDDDYLKEIIQKKWPAESDNPEYTDSLDEDGAILNDLLMYLKGKLIDMLNLTAAKNLPQGFKRVLQHCLEKNKIFSEINYKDLHPSDSHDNTFKENFEIISEDDQQRPLFSNYDEIIPEALFGVRRNLSNYKDSEVKEILDSLIETVEKGKVTQSLVRYYSLFFSETKPNYCAGRLLEILRSNPNPETKKLCSRLLYAIELGRVNVSQEGVKYLEKMYDLEEYNNPNNFVQRLTVEGDIGVFNESRELAGYFNLGDLSKDTEKVKAQVLSFTYETLFLPKTDETKEEQKERENILEEFKKNYFNFYDDRFFKETDVKFNNLSFKEQGWFMHYMQESNEVKKNRALVFVKKFREDGFKTFLSLEYGRELGDKILNLGEKLENNGAEMIFAKFNSIINLANTLEPELRGLLNDQEKSQIHKSKISEQLLKRAKDLLVDFSDKLDKSEEINYQEIVNALNQISEQIIRFASIFKVASQEQLITFNELASAEFVIKNSSQLTNEEKTEMMQFFIKNRPYYPKALLEATTGELKEALNSPNKLFYLLKYNNELTSFIRADYLPNGHVYVGSFNVRPEVKDSAIGSAMLKATLDGLAKDHVIESVVNINNPMTKHYLKDFGYKIIDIDMDFHQSGQPFFKMRRDDKKEWNLNDRSINEKDVIEQGEIGNSGENMRIVVVDIKNPHQQLNKLKQSLNEGEVISHYFLTKEKEKIYLVIEKPASKKTRQAA